MGSGAFSGRGNQATQTVLDFLPEHHTDFIFAVIGERYGFVGAAVLLALFVVRHLARPAHRHDLARPLRQHDRRLHRRHLSV